MTMTRFVVQAPRVLGALLAAFFAVFAFDSFGRLPLPQAIVAIAMNLLPAAIVLTLVVIGWRRPFAGAMGFFFAAALYAYGVSASAAPRARADWIAAISGPLVLVGAGFLWSWLRQPRPARDAGAR
jgi:hypothetical protein